MDNLLPPIATYGVGLSIVMFAKEPEIIISLESSISKKRVNQVVDRMTIMGLFLPTLVVFNNLFIPRFKHKRLSKALKTNERFQSLSIGNGLLV